RGLHRIPLERAVQADGGVLQHVVGLLPAVDVGVTPEHLAGELAQALAGAAEQLAARRLVAAADAVEAGLDVQRLRGRIGHGTAPPETSSEQGSSHGPAKCSRFSRPTLSNSSSAPESDRLSSSRLQVAIPVAGSPTTTPPSSNSCSTT